HVEECLMRAYIGKVTKRLVLFWRKHWGEPNFLGCSSRYRNYRMVKSVPLLYLRPVATPADRYAPFREGNFDHLRLVANSILQACSQRRGEALCSANDAQMRRVEKTPPVDKYSLGGHALIGLEPRSIKNVADKVRGRMTAE